MYADLNLNEKIKKRKLFLHQKRLLLHHFMQGNSARKTLKEICNTQGSNDIRLSTIKCWFARFNKGNLHVEDTKNTFFMPCPPQKVKIVDDVEGVEQHRSFHELKWIQEAQIRADAALARLHDEKVECSLCNQRVYNHQRARKEHVRMNHYKVGDTKEHVLLRIRECFQVARLRLITFDNQCQQCEKAIKSRQDKEIHVASHLGLKFPCVFADCAILFGSMRALSLHLKKFHNVYVSKMEGDARVEYERTNQDFLQKVTPFIPHFFPAELKKKRSLFLL